MTSTIRTQRLAWARKRAFGHVSLADVLGRQAVFTTAEGDRLIGTITGEDPAGMHYLHVTFPDGRWARLDGTVTLVREDAQP